MHLVLCLVLWHTLSIASDAQMVRASRLLTRAAQCRIPPEIAARIHWVGLIVRRHGIRQLDRRRAHRQGPIDTGRAVATDSIA